MSALLYSKKAIREEAEEERFRSAMALRIQCMFRRFRAKLLLKRRRYAKQARNRVNRGVILLQSVCRGVSARLNVAELIRQKKAILVAGSLAVRIQSYYRGYIARRSYFYMLRTDSAVIVQRCFRGHIAREIRRAVELRMREICLLNFAAIKIQTYWRMKVCREEFLRLRWYSIAAILIQKTFRGKIGRSHVSRLSRWRSASSAVERVMIGMDLIDLLSKKFKIQREEILTCKNAQNRVLQRLSNANGRLKACERLCSSLQFESFSLRRMDRHMSTKQPNLGVFRVLNKVPQRFLASSFERVADRSKEEKEKLIEELQRLSFIVATLKSAFLKLESTATRKLLELERLFYDGNELLRLQYEIIVAARRTSRIQLEESAVSNAQDTYLSALVYEQYEKKVRHLFSETEMLLKYQFISSSLSYVSRAPRPSCQMRVKARVVENLAKSPVNHIQPTNAYNNMQVWTVDDVLEWLVRIGELESVPLFRRAAVDGRCLLSISSDDLIDIVGIVRASAVKTILLARDSYAKGSPMSLKQHESLNPSIVPIESVFAQITAGRVKRVEDSLNSGFPINCCDPNGTTLLMIACRNKHRRIVEVLVTRGADVNLQDDAGNTALHICFLVRGSESIADFLISHGADDSIRNGQDLTAYEVEMEFEEN